MSDSHDPHSPAVSKVLAIWALGLGVTAYLFAAPGFSIAAAVCGHLHLSKTTPGAGKGRGMAVCGLIAAYVAFAIYLNKIGIIG